MNKLKERYYKTEAGQLVLTRNKIAIACGINIQTFYRWLEEPNNIKPPARRVIAEILNEPEADLFPETYEDKVTARTAKLRELSVIKHNL